MSKNPAPAELATAPAVKPPVKRAARPLLGVLFMLLAGLAFVSQSVSVKAVGQTVEPLQSLFLRYVLGLFFIIPFIPAMRRAGFQGRDASGHLARSLLQAIASLLWFYALVHVPMAEVTSMGYLQPLYMTIGAALFFGERLAARRILAIVVALIGVCIVLRPGFREISSGQLAMLVQTPLMAAGYLLAKSLSARTSPEAVLGWMSLLVPILLAPFALMSWQPVTLKELSIIFLSAMFSTIGHWGVLRALNAAPVAVTQPVIFLQLIWSVAAGALIFGEAVDKMVVLGGTVIVAAVVFIVIREHQLAQMAKRGAA